MKYLILLLMLCSICLADTIKQIETSCVIYELDTGNVCSVIKGNITITADKITNEKGEGLKGIKPNKIGYMLTDKEIELEPEEEVKFESLKLSIEKHNELMKEINIKTLEDRLKELEDKIKILEAKDK